MDTVFGDRLSRSKQALLMGIGANVVLASVKGTAGVIGNSQALIADAVESLMDIVNAFGIWIGLQISSVPPDKNHPYGHGKAEPLVTCAVAFILIGVAVGIARESIHQILTPHEMPAPFTLVVLTLVILTKEVLSRRVTSEAEALESTLLQGDAAHHRTDALTSLAAFIGIAVGLLGGPGWERSDDWAALFASSIIFFNASVLLMTGVHELMDRAPSPALEGEVRETAGAVAGVLGLDRCIVRKMGFALYVDLDILVDPASTVAEGHLIAHHVQDAVRKSNVRIRRVLVHVEPFESG